MGQNILLVCIVASNLATAFMARKMDSDIPKHRHCDSTACMASIQYVLIVMKNCILIILFTT